MISGRFAPMVDVSLVVVARRCRAALLRFLEDPTPNLRDWWQAEYSAALLWPPAGGFVAPAPSMVAYARRRADAFLRVVSLCGPEIGLARLPSHLALVRVRDDRGRVGLIPFDAGESLDRRVLGLAAATVALPLVEGAGALRHRPRRARSHRAFDGRSPAPGASMPR